MLFIITGMIKALILGKGNRGKRSGKHQKQQVAVLGQGSVSRKDKYYLFSSQKIL